MTRRRGKEPSSAGVIAQSTVDRSGDGPESVSISVRQISNGFVSTHSREENGEYHSKEEYHATRPNVEEMVAGDIEKRALTPPGANHLRGAIGLMKGGRV